MASAEDARPYAEMGFRIADRRREISRRRGRQLRQVDVAEALGVAVPTVINWETGKRLLGSDHLMRLADLLETTPQWIWTGEGDPDAPAPQGREAELLTETRALRLLGDIAPPGEAAELKADQLQLIRKVALRRGVELPAWWYELLRRVDAGEL